MSSGLGGKETLFSALRGQGSAVATGPLAVHYCGQFGGVSLRDYTLDARTLAECVLRYFEQFRPDAVWVSADTWVSAEAMGKPVAFPGSGQPLGGTPEPLVRTREDVDRIPLPDPSRQGRYPLMVEAVARVAEGLRGRASLVACFDQYPFSLACALMGMERLMLALSDDRPLVEALVERCTAYAAAYGAALAGAGADLLSGGDSPAGLIGPRLYREIAWPSEQQVISRLKAATSLPISLHICGNATPILADMARTEADILEIDHQVDIVEACRLVPPDVALWGNLDPVQLLARGTPQDVTAATLALLRSVDQAGRSRFVLSSGCTLAVDTPPENLSALFAAARRHVRFPASHLLQPQIP